VQPARWTHRLPEPALAPAAQVALTLRLLGGLTTPEIARAFLVPEATMAQRIVWAKGKIRDAGIPYRIPAKDDLPARVLEATVTPATSSRCCRLRLRSGIHWRVGGLVPGRFGTAERLVEQWR
jgi:hypothetical protein